MSAKSYILKGDVMPAQWSNKHIDAIYINI